MEEETKNLIVILTGALDQASAAAAMLIARLDKQEQETRPGASSNPDFCTHPNLLELSTLGGPSYICDDCGTNLGKDPPPTG